MKKIGLWLLIGALTIPGVVSAQKQKVNNTQVIKSDSLKNDSLKILSDKNAELYLRLAQISLDSKDYKSTVAYADSALARDKSFRGYRLRGLGQFNLGLYKETILSMSQGIEKRQSDFALHYYRGLSYHIIDSLLYAEQISQDMTWAITISPLDTMAYYYRGMADFNLSFSANYKKDDKLKDCIGSLAQFTKLKPTFAAHYIKGIANFLLGGSGELTEPGQYYTETIKDMTACLKFQSGDEDCLYYRGLSYYIIGDYENAIKDAEVLKSQKKSGDKTVKTKKGFFGSKK